MFDAQQKATGTRYTTTVALLAVAFIFIPAVLFVSRPFRYISLFIAIACSVICVISAWRLWKRYSQLSITSIAVLDSRTK